MGGGGIGDGKDPIITSSTSSSFLSLWGTSTALQAFVIFSLTKSLTGGYQRNVLTYGHSNPAVQ